MEYWVKLPRKKKVCRAIESRTLCGKKVKEKAERVDKVERGEVCSKCMEALVLRKRGHKITPPPEEPEQEEQEPEEQESEDSEPVKEYRFTF